MKKNNFDSLSKNKIEFSRLLAFDDELAKIMINGSPKYKDNEVTDVEKSELIKTQIYPYPKIMEGMEEVKSYITMKFQYRPTSGGNIYKTSSIRFAIFCHNSIIGTSYMELRYDAMTRCVNRLINDTRSKNWIGIMKFDGMEDISIDSKGTYIGNILKYKSTEFQ